MMVNSVALAAGLAGDARGLRGFLTIRLLGTTQVGISGAESQRHEQQTTVVRNSKVSTYICGLWTSQTFTLFHNLPAGLCRNNTIKLATLLAIVGLDFVTASPRKTGLAADPERALGKDGGALISWDPADAYK